VAPVPRTLHEAIQTYLTHARHHYSPQISTAYSQALNLFANVLQEKLRVRPTATLQELDVEWGDEYLQYLQAERSVETEHLYTRALLDFYRYVEEQQWAEPHFEELSQRFTAKRRPKKHIAPTPPTEAIEKILAYAQATTVPPEGKETHRERLRIQRDKAILFTLAETGLRVSEICSLRKSQVDLERQSLLLHSMIMPITNTVSKAIQVYLEERAKLDKENDDQLPLFARHDKRAGKRILSISRWTVGNIVKHWTQTALPDEMQLQLERNAQPITPQTFRHYFVIKTLLQTGDLALTQALARHADPSTTKRYLHTTASNPDRPDE
jgi:integrase